MQEIEDDHCHVTSLKNLRVLVRMILMRRDHIYEKLKMFDEAEKDQDEEIYWNMIKGFLSFKKINSLFKRQIIFFRYASWRKIDS